MSKNTVDAVETACGVLAALQDLNGGGVTEVADHLGRSKGTVHRHLATLRENELVTKHGDTYHLSLKFMDFGEFVKSRMPVYEFMVDEVDSLADETGEVAQTMTEEHGHGIYLYKRAGKNAVNTAASIGNRKPLHCTALGKAILAHLPEERVSEIIAERGLPAVTKNTITEESALKEELVEVRDQGVAFDDEEIQPGLRCVAAPIQHYDGDVLGAISVSAPISRMGESRFRNEIPQLVLSAANVIEINATNVNR